MKITGKHLIEKGYRPGSWFREALDYLNSQELTDAETMQYLDRVIPQTIDPYAVAPSYHVNIEADNEIEHANVASVKLTMDELMKTPTLIDGAIMPDACPTGAKGQIPVGGIAVAVDAIHPAMHSADVCCSVMMTSYGHVDPKTVLDKAQRITHFGYGGRKDLFDLPEQIKMDMRSNHFLRDEKSEMLARTHLGTQGDGNHFLYVGISEKTGETIMVTHHGSRGLGAHLYKHAMKVAEAFRKEISPKTLKKNAWIPYTDEKGKDYWEALQIIRAWTKLNHQVLHQTVERSVKADIKDHFWNEHNFVFKEDNRFYHAKGATPIKSSFVPDAQDARRLIPLNMSEPVLIVEGETTDNNLGFAPHGAGRNVSRSQHKRDKADKTVEQIFAEETKGLDVRFYSGVTDISELPSAYKNADAVQRQMEQFNLGSITDRIMPYGCIMAGDWKQTRPWRKKKKK